MCSLGTVYFPSWLLFLITCSMSACSDVSSLMSYLARIFMMGLIFSHHCDLGMRCLQQTEEVLFHTFTTILVICSTVCHVENTHLTQNLFLPSVQQEAGRWATSFSCPGHRQSLPCLQRCDLKKWTVQFQYQLIIHCIVREVFWSLNSHKCILSPRLVAHYYITFFTQNLTYQ